MYSPFKSLSRVSKLSSASKKRNNLRIESLEDRSMMDAALGAVVAKPTLNAPIDVIPLPSIVLSSNPGAPKTIYLDFNGNTEAKWASDGWKFSNVVTPAYDTDGAPSTFNFDERQVIREVWTRMAEDYAPFNVNVTTVDPGAATWANPNNVAMRVVFGGKQSDMHVDSSSPKTQSAWNSLANSGYSSIGSFGGAEPNTVYVFTASMTQWSKDNGMDWNGVKMTGHLPEYFANVGSHEVGHTVGLFHDNIYDGLGNVIDYYSAGTSTWTPMMGESISTDRTTWTFGQIGATQVRSPFTGQVMYAIPQYQDDLAILTATLGARADEAGNTIGTAKALSVSPLSYVGTNSYQAKGIISTMADADYYSFNVSLAGSVTVSTTTLSYGANLDSMVELYRSNGTLVTSSDVLGRLDAGLTTYLTPGTYFAAVKSHGTYGDLGQYTLDISTPKLAAARSAMVSTESLWMAGGGTTSNTTTTTPKSASVANPIVSKAGGGTMATAPMQVAADSFFAEFETKATKSNASAFESFDLFANIGVNAKLSKALV